MPLSLSDYPGRVASVVFTQGCNMRCPFCHNGELLPARSPAGQEISPEEVLSRLEALQDRLDGVVVSGGEPTMHHDLPSFLHRLRELNFDVKLDTNGAYPERLQCILEERLVDYVAMDVKAPPEKYDVLAGVPIPGERIKASMHIIAQSGVEHHFRTTFVPQLLTEDDVASIREIIPPGSEHRIQRFVPDYALDHQLRHAD